DQAQHRGSGIAKYFSDLSGLRYHGVPQPRTAEHWQNLKTNIRLGRDVSQSKYPVAPTATRSMPKEESQLLRRAHGHGSKKRRLKRKGRSVSASRGGPDRLWRARGCRGPGSTIVASTAFSLAANSPLVRKILYPNLAQ